MLFAPGIIWNSKKDDKFFATKIIETVLWSGQNSLLPEYCIKFKYSTYINSENFE
jgi:hypothetical protein